MVTLRDTTVRAELIKSATLVRGTMMPRPPQPRVLMLDAMGVIFEAGDDVAELLVPFVQLYGDGVDEAAVAAAYMEASQGRLTAAAFWRQMGIDPSLEDTYLAAHRLTPDALLLLQRARARFEAVFCLSNDVSEWSRKLRQTFDLEQYVDAWFISGDLGVRKPATEIYEAVLIKSGFSAEEILFVDDRPKNLDAARRIGIQTVLYAAGTPDEHTAHVHLSRLSDLIACPRPEV